VGRGQGPLESREAWRIFQEASSVFLDPDFWSEERLLQALRMLVSLAERSSRSVA
jgi:hypothetical protein